MAVILFANRLSGTTGLDKSVIQTANLLVENGVNTKLLTLMQSAIRENDLRTKWPLDERVEVQHFSTIALVNSNAMAKRYERFSSIQLTNLSHSFSMYEKLVMSELADRITTTDLVLLTHPLQIAFIHQALDGQRLKARTILQIHGNYLDDHPDLLDVLVEHQGHIDGLQIVARGMAPDLIRHTSFDNQSIHWIPNYHPPSKPVTRIASPSVRLSVIGSFQDRKNQMSAVKAFSLLSDQDAILNFWGNHKNQYGQEVQALVSQLGLEKRVVFNGVATEEAIYTQTDIAVIPSKSEGFCYILLEASCHCIPVIAFDYRFGATDAIDDGETGFVVPQSNERALADSMDQLIRDHQAREAMGIAANKKYTREFSQEAVFDRYLIIMDGIDLGPKHLFPRRPKIIDSQAGTFRLDSTKVKLLGFTVMYLISMPHLKERHSLHIQTSSRSRSAFSINFRGRTHVFLFPHTSRAKRLQKGVTLYVDLDVENKTRSYVLFES